MVDEIGKLVIFGTKEIAEVIAFYFDCDSSYKVAAFTADGAYIDAPTFMGKPVVPFEEITQHYPPDEYQMFIAVSYQKVNRIRAQKFAEAKASGTRSPATSAPKLIRGRALKSARTPS